MKTEAELAELLRVTGALREGHFPNTKQRLLHPALAFQRPEFLACFAESLVAKCREFGADTVISPAMGGLVIGQEVARKLGVRFIFADKMNDGRRDRLILRRGFYMFPGEKVLLVDDVASNPSGGRIQETIDLARGYGSVVAGIGVVISQCSVPFQFKPPVVWLVSLVPDTFVSAEVAASAGKPHPP